MGLTHLADFVFGIRQDAEMLVKLLYIIGTHFWINRRFWVREISQAGQKSGTVDPVLERLGSTVKRCSALPAAASENYFSLPSRSYSKSRLEAR